MSAIPPVPSPESPAGGAGKTLATLLLDRSGSMQAILDDTLGGTNAWVDALRAAAGDVRLTLVLFDAEGDRMDLRTVFVARRVAEVPALTRADYVPRGTTPLIDAAYATIEATQVALDLRTSPEPVRVVIAIQTDGMENASRRHGWDELKALIAAKEAQGWEFAFMGAGIDAYDQGRRMGLRDDKIVAYATGREETLAAFRAAGSNMADYASGLAESTAYTPEQKRAAGDRFDPARAGEPG